MGVGLVSRQATKSRQITNVSSASGSESSLRNEKIYLHDAFTLINIKHDLGN